MKRTALKATFTIGKNNENTAEYVLYMPEDSYSGYGNGMSSTLKTDEEGTMPMYFDERYNTKLSKRMTDDKFKDYVKENILTRFRFVDADSIKLTKTEVKDETV